jgi:hypothetical protein
MSDRGRSVRVPSHDGRRRRRRFRGRDFFFGNDVSIRDDNVLFVVRYGGNLYRHDDVGQLWDIELHEHRQRRDVDRLRAVPLRRHDAPARDL